MKITVDQQFWEILLSIRRIIKPRTKSLTLITNAGNDIKQVAMTCLNACVN